MRSGASTHERDAQLSAVSRSCSPCTSASTAEKIYNNDWWRGGTSIQAKDAGVVLPPAVHDALKGVFPERACPAPGDKKPSTHAGAARRTVRLSSASNSWVVSGELSESGRPIVAGDPHMAHLLPSIVFQQHLRAPGVDVIGVTVAGLPWILAGHNRHVAWSMTSLVGDAVDLYIERVNPKDPGGYETPAGMRKFGKDELVIGLRNGSAMTETATMRRMAHGVLVNDMYPGLLPGGADRAQVGQRPTARRSTRLGQPRHERRVSPPAARPRRRRPDRRRRQGRSPRSPPAAPRAQNLAPSRPGWNGCCEDGKVDPMTLPGYVDDRVHAHANNLIVDPSKSGLQRRQRAVVPLIGSSF